MTRRKSSEAFGVCDGLLRVAVDPRFASECWPEENGGVEGGNIGAARLMALLVSVVVTVLLIWL